MTKFVAAGKDCWLTRVNKFKSCLGIKVPNACNPSTAGKHIKGQVQSKFQVHWLNYINKIRLNSEGRDQIN